MSPATFLEETRTCNYLTNKVLYLLMIALFTCFLIKLNEILSLDLKRARQLSRTSPTSKCFWIFLAKAFTVWRESFSTLIGWSVSSITHVNVFSTLLDIVYNIEWGVECIVYIFLFFITWKLTCNFMCFVLKYLSARRKMNTQYKLSIYLYVLRKKELLQLWILSLILCFIFIERDTRFDTQALITPSCYSLQYKWTMHTILTYTNCASFSLIETIHKLVTDKFA